MCIKRRRYEGAYIDVHIRAGAGARRKSIRGDVVAGARLVGRERLYKGLQMSHLSGATCALGERAHERGLILDVESLNGGRGATGCSYVGKLDFWK